GDLLRLVESDVRPALAAVGRLVHAVALRDVGAHVGFAGADVDHVRIRLRDRERADRADRLRVEDRLPRSSGVVRFPHSAVDAAEVEMLRLAWDSTDSEYAAAAKRADQPPVEVGWFGKRHTKKDCK